MYSIIHDIQSQAWQEDTTMLVWGVLEFNFLSEALNRQVCCRTWSNCNGTTFFQSLSYNSSIFPLLFGITVLVTCHFIPAIVSLHKYLPIFHPTNISPLTVGDLRLYCTYIYPGRSWCCGVFVSIIQLLVVMVIMCTDLLREWRNRCTNYPQLFMPSVNMFIMIKQLPAVQRNCARDAMYIGYLYVL